ncbi:hypothetical protein DFH07DRAFT_968650 [Mycena maculata]|uniref:Uncharacterized protein n=1 Tax=Mycena maculata TaxID=230809 RepID=A0AAD7MTX4_9AGAR|nr:hypothetical protein DFH07DRAFT_968650 [Mycena maculata]
MRVTGALTVALTLPSRFVPIPSPLPSGIFEDVDLSTPRTPFTPRNPFTPTRFASPPYATFPLTPAGDSWKIGTQGSIPALDRNREDIGSAPVTPTNTVPTPTAAPVKAAFPTAEMPSLPTAISARKHRHQPHGPTRAGSDPTRLRPSKPMPTLKFPTPAYLLPWDPLATSPPAPFPAVSARVFSNASLDKPEE